MAAAASADATRDVSDVIDDARRADVDRYLMYYLNEKGERVYTLKVRSLRARARAIERGGEGRLTEARARRAEDGA